MRRVASILTLLALMLAQAWAGPVARLAARACCCKSGEATQQRIAKARCCGQGDTSRPVARAIARVEQQDEAVVLVAVVRHAEAGLLPSSSLASLLSIDRPPGLGSASGLPYRLRV